MVLILGAAVICLLDRLQVLSRQDARRPDAGEYGASVVTLPSARRRSELRGGRGVSAGAVRDCQSHVLSVMPDAMLSMQDPSVLARRADGGWLSQLAALVSGGGQRPSMLSGADTCAEYGVRGRRG